MSRFIEAFGPDRVVWASNGPICNLHGSLERWVSLTAGFLWKKSREFLTEYSPFERAAILRSKGERVYGLL